MTKGKEVAKAEDNAVAEWGDYMGDGGATGLDDVDRSEMLIPYITLLQSNSEMVEEDNAKAGQFLNTAFETVSDEVLFVPCARTRVFIERIPYDDGGGYIGTHQPGDQIVVDAIAANNDSVVGLEIKGEDGKTHELVETYQLYVLIIDPEDETNVTQAVIGFSSAKIKAYRKFMMKAMGQQVVANGKRFTLPMWAHVYKMTSVQEVSKRNNKKFQNVTVAFNAANAKECRLAPSDALFDAGSSFHELVTSGQAKADETTADQRGDSAAGGSEPAGDASSEEIPI